MLKLDPRISNSSPTRPLPEISLQTQPAAHTPVPSHDTPHNQTSAAPIHRPSFFQNTFRSLHNFFKIHKSPDGESDIAANVPLFAIASGLTLQILHLRRDPLFALTASLSGIALAVYSNSLIRKNLNEHNSSVVTHNRPSAEKANLSRQIRHPETLNTLARTALEGSNRRFDYAGFSIQTQRERELHPDLEALQSEWNHFLQETPSQISGNEDPIRKIRTVVRELKRHFGIHKADDSQTNMNELLMHRRANCQARAWLIVAAIHALNLPIPAPWRLGIQVFGKSQNSDNGHVQAVLYNSQTGQVLDLLTGHSENQVLAPIFEERILLHAYLAADTSQHSFIRSHPAEHYLIARAIPQNTNRSNQNSVTIHTNSLSSFPQNENVYSGSVSTETQDIDIEFNDLVEAHNLELAPEGEYHIRVGYPDQFNETYSRFWLGDNFANEATVRAVYFIRQRDANRFSNTVHTTEEWNIFFRNLHFEQIRNTLNDRAFQTFIGEMQTTEDFPRYLQSHSQDEMREIFKSLIERRSNLNAYLNHLPTNHPHRLLLQQLQNLQQDTERRFQRSPFETFILCLQIDDWIAFSATPNIGNSFQNENIQNVFFQEARDRFQALVQHNPNFVELHNLNSNIGMEEERRPNETSRLEAIQLEQYLFALMIFVRTASLSSSTHRNYFNFLQQVARPELVRMIDQSRDLSRARNIFINWIDGMIFRFQEAEFFRENHISFEDSRNWRSDTRGSETTRQLGYSNSQTGQFIPYDRPDYTRLLIP